VKKNKNFDLRKTEVFIVGERSISTMSISVETVKQFYSQGYHQVYDEGQPLKILPKTWSFHIHGLGIEPADRLDEASTYPYLRTLRFAFDLELIWHTPESRGSQYSTQFADYLIRYDMPYSMLSDARRVSESVAISAQDLDEDDLEFEIPEDAHIDPRFLGIEEEQIELPSSVWESYRFYSENVTKQDWGTAYGLRVTIEGQDTLIVRTTTDGSNGWLEVFDTQGNYLAAARTTSDSIAWRSLGQIRGYVLGGTRFPPELE
jgi:hypothetical protein